MAPNRQPSSFLPRWLFWVESLVLVTITALLTFLVLKDDPPGFPFVLYGSGVVAPPSLIGFGTVLFLAVHTADQEKLSHGSIDRVDRRMHRHVRQYASGESSLECAASSLSHPMRKPRHHGES